MRNLWYVRIFESVVRELVSRGHVVHLAAGGGRDRERAQEWNDAAQALAAELPNLTLAWAPRPIADDWVDLRIGVHLGLDYLRFLAPAYAAAPMLLERARERAPAFIVRLSERPVLRTAAGRWALSSVLRVIECALPYDEGLATSMRDARPDVVLVTPLLTLGSDQHDVLRVAGTMGVPSVLCVGSWDHLSSKALLREVPSRVLVWNDTQKREAVELHGIPASRVTVTGAQCFDQWFDRQATWTREAFCARVGLDPARPFVTYVCSALFAGSPSEAEFVRTWVRALRASADPVVASVGVLVRQHPKRGFEWDAVSLDGIDNAVVWPPKAAAPFRDDTKSDYFDSLHHSAAVVGLNTSALIEAGIVGRPVHTVLLPEFQQNQEGTLHFHYLLDLGLLRTSRSLGAHVAQLGESLRASSGTLHNRDFVSTFVRPRGLDVSATQAVADAIEAVASLPTPVQRSPVWVRPVRAWLRPLARRVHGTLAEQVHRERRRHAKESAREVRVAEEARAREEELRDKRAAKAERLLERRARFAEKRRAQDVLRRNRELDAAGRPEHSR